ncbi:XRN 5'-3' exonuclease N-terminus-domain-containing protein [Hyaloraphidium curvatum]|nr:XRN 5'-3' exonuclease N-terminus-domain-containing protein [Hyaloraphidium curvatum]
MGVPALFRWLSQKYPKITAPVVEDLPDKADDDPRPADWSGPNPNGWELDNLYLDMNGIIHPCTHPEDKPAPETEDAMFVEVCLYIDRLMAMARPRKLVYMAIDGVAPRAKMNQQRSRRFRAAQEAQDKADDEERIRSEWEADGGKLPPVEGDLEGSKKKPFDSNCITPGTPFMANLAICLRYYITDRLQNNPAWKNLKIILSDASAPGEGEHKIMHFVRRQRLSPGYDANTTHCLYGLDADLIMLALATHEPHFSILREDVFAKEGGGKCFVCGRPGHQAANCPGKLPPGQGEEKDKDPDAGYKPFVFLHVPVLREYLEAELRVSSPLPKWDLERAIDDWVFLVFFVGNDFLPHLPSLEIREGAIDALVGIWKNVVPRLGRYLTDSGEVDLEAAEQVLSELGRREDGIFRERRRKEEQKREAAKRRAEEARDRKERGGRRHVRFDEVPEGARQAGVSAEAMAVPVQRRDPRALGLPGADAPPPMVPLQTREQRDKANAEAARKLREKLMVKRASASPDVAAAAAAAKPEPVSADLAASTDAEPMDTDADEAKRGVKRKAEEIEEAAEGKKEPNGIGLGIDAVAAETTQTDSELPDSVPAEDSAPLNGDDSVATDAEVKEEPIPDEIELELEEDEAEEALGVEDTLTVADVPIPHQVRKESIKGAVEGEEEPYDDVRLWEDGWKSRYYRNKFGVAEDDASFKRSLVKAYVEGFSWVLKYYYQGVRSWKWFYPYHYSPFASDFVELASLDINFELGTPFRPIEQLMGVLPAASRAHIPAPFHPLMTEPDSEIYDFYPEKFQIDLNGKKYAWQGVALLPFIDEKRLLDAIEPRYEFITDDERKRNTQGPELIFVGAGSPLYDVLCAAYGGEDAPLPIGDVGGTFGTVARDADFCPPGSKFVSPLKLQGLPDLEKTSAISAVFEHPEFPEGRFHRAELLPTVKLPPRVLSNDDIMWIRMGRPGRPRMDGGAAARFANHGMGRGGSPRFNGDRRDNRGNGDRHGNDGYDPRRESYPPRGGRGNDYSDPPRRGSPGGGWRPSSSYNDSYRSQGGQYGSREPDRYPSPGQGGQGGSYYGGQPSQDSQPGRITAYGSSAGKITAYGSAAGVQQPYGGQPAPQAGYGYGQQQLNPNAAAFVPGSAYPSPANQAYPQTGYNQQQAYGQQPAYGQPPAQTATYPPYPQTGATYTGMYPSAGTAYPSAGSGAMYPSTGSYGAAPPPPLQPARPPYTNLAWNRNIATTSEASRGRGGYAGGGGYRPPR